MLVCECVNIMGWGIRYSGQLGIFSSPQFEYCVANLTQRGQVTYKETRKRVSKPSMKILDAPRCRDLPPKYLLESKDSHYKQCEDPNQ